MKVKEIKTNQEVDLNNKNFLASGGEGSVYRIQNKCYKIYNDKNKMIPTGKVQELQVLQSKNIINPLSLLTDSKGRYIGYSMNYISECVTLCNLFPLSFKNRNNIKLEDINKLVLSIKNIFDIFHNNKMLIVDANEYNFLVKDKYFNDIFLIDTDSCQTPSYPATAIMESIKDFHTKSFSVMSDWFSFAILAFQLYTGLHPFKGKHKDINSFTDKMKKNISVYNSEVTVPAFIRNFESLIPVNYNEWFKIMFTTTNRELPPLSFTDAMIKVLKQIVVKNSKLDIELLKTFTSNIVFMKENIVLTLDGLYIKDRLFKDIAPYSEIVTIDFNNITQVYSCITKNDKLMVRNVLDQKNIECDILSQHIVVSAPNKKIGNNKLYSIYNNILSSIDFYPKFNSLSITKLSDLSSSYKVYQGVIFQPILDTVYVTLLRGIQGALETIQVKELIGYRIINAELKENVLIVTSELKGSIKRFIIRFYTNDIFYDKYSIQVQDNILDTNINFIVLDSGVCILSDINQGLFLFRTNPDDCTFNLLDDLSIVGYKLYSNNNDAYYVEDNKIFKFKKSV